MADEFTPTTEQVRDVWMHDPGSPTIPLGVERAHQFDRWLAAVRRVAPDREKLANIEQIIHMMIEAEWGTYWIEQMRSLASGVLGVPADQQARLDEAEEKITFLDEGCLNMTREQLIQRITAVGSARWKAGAYWQERDQRKYEAGKRDSAEQRTADRETIERAITEAWGNAMAGADGEPGGPAILADAVLAVLVPAKPNPA